MSIFAKGRGDGSGVVGMVANFSTPADLLNAAKSARESGYRKFDCHSPFPIHGLDAAMGLRRSYVGWIAGIAGVSGAIVGMALQWWANAFEYKIVVSGKPFFSYQAFVPITFEIAILSAAFGAVGAMFFFNKLPRFHHPLFHSELLKKASDDGFVLSVEASDVLFEPTKTEQWLKSLGAHEVELVQGEDGDA